MVRECRPPAREPTRSWLARRSTIATSTPANASSPANISPVGPPPAITTACSVIATLRSASRRSRPAHHIPWPPRRVPPAAPRVPPSVRRLRATHTLTTTHAFRASGFRRFWRTQVILRHTPGLAASPQTRDNLRVARSEYPPFPSSSALFCSTRHPPRLPRSPAPTRETRPSPEPEPRVPSPQSRI